MTLVSRNARSRCGLFSLAVVSRAVLVVLGFLSLCHDSQGADLTATWDSSTDDWSDGTHWLDTNPNFPNNGAVTYDAVISGGAVTLDQDIVINLLQLTGGLIDGSSNLTLETGLTWSGGTMSGSGQTTLANTATGTISSFSFNTFLDGRTLANEGTITQGSSSTLYVLNGGSVNNSGTWDFTADSNSVSYHSGAVGSFNNSGQLLKSAGSGTSYIDLPVTNSGTATAQSGTLSLNLADTATSSGDFTADSGATVQLSSLGTHTITGTVGGSGSVEFVGGTIDVNSTYSSGGNTSITGGAVNFNAAATTGGATSVAGGTANFNAASSTQNYTQTFGTLGGTDNLTVNGTFAWSGGTMSGSGQTALASTATGAISYTGFTILLDQRSLANEGTMTQESSSTLYVSNGGTVDNSGTWDFAGDSNGVYNGDGFAGGFTNSGQLLKSAGSGVSSINIPVTNSGTVEVQAGTLSFASFTQTAGELRLSGGDVQSSTPFDIQAGIVTGNGSLSTDVNLGGTISPGLSIGGLTIQGTLTFQSGTYAAELGSPGQADLLTITQTLDLSGLGDSLILSGGIFGQTYTIAQFDALLGAFESVSPGYTVAYLANSIEVTAVPEPGSFLLAAISTAVVVASLRRCKRGNGTRNTYLL
jgi:hypothetical protein